MSENQIEAISLMPDGGSKPTHLLLMLHGWGANYRDLVPLAQILDIPKLGCLFPNAPFSHPHVPDGRAWYELETQDFRGLSTSQELLFDWIMSLKASTGVPLERTIMAGFSQGGAMTLDVGLTLPLAGLCSMSGFLHYHPELVEETDFPPVLMIHGKQDSVVPLEAAQEARDELTKIGVTIDYREFDMGHEIAPPALTTLQQFVEKIVTGN
jgi:phospholipase/carboxylesterase